MNEQQQPNSQRASFRRRPIRIALVGAGKIACDAHLPAIQANSDFELVALADPSPQVEGIACYPSLESLLACEPDLDAVAICTPPEIRAQLAEMAIGAGLSVLLEKPPAASSGEIEHLAALAAQAQVSLFTAWHSREAPGVEPARHWLAPRRIEKIDVYWREHIDAFHPGQDWIRAAGGFGVFDPAINALSILTALFDDRISLGDCRLRVPPDWGAPVAAELALHLDGERVGGASFALDIEGEPEWVIDVLTDLGPLTLADGGARLRVVGVPVQLVPTPEYPSLYARFARLVLAGASEVDWRPLSLVEHAMADACGVPVGDMIYVGGEN